MSKTFLDLRSSYNHRMVYPDDVELNDDKPIGISNTYFKESSVSFDTLIEAEEMACMLRRNDQALDNVVCDSQVLDVDDVAMNRIVIVGFTSWGHYRENFLLKFSDGTQSKAKAYFSDAVWPSTELAKYATGMDRRDYLDGCKIAYQVQSRDRKGYLYYYVTEYETEKKLRQILFPDNCLMNIFAITLENEGKEENHGIK